jgi:hypothetical protein
MSPFQQAIAFLKQKGAEVSQLQQVQAIRSVAKQAADTYGPILDPSREDVPILGNIRQYNRQHFGVQPYADPSKSPEERIVAAIGAYGSTFMGAHGDAVPAATPKLTTTILDRLDGKQQVSPQYIENLTRMKDVKQADALLAQKVLAGMKQPKAAEAGLSSTPTLYRGEGGNNKFSGVSSWVNGKHFATDSERANQFGAVTEHSLNPDAKILKIDTRGKSLEQLAKELNVTPEDVMSSKRMNEILKSRGYDAIDHTTRIVDENGRISDKSKSVRDFIVLNEDAINPRVANAGLSDTGTKDAFFKKINELHARGITEDSQIPPKDLAELNALKDQLGKEAGHVAQQPVSDTQVASKIAVPEFAEKMRGELLPLEATVEPSSNGTRYEHVSLPSDVKGNVANYRENIYQSPIQTSAGGVHFTGDEVPNYFAHTRTEDLQSYPNAKMVHDPEGSRLINKDIWDLVDENGRSIMTGQRAGIEKTFNATREPTRRVIEIQSDLFQKGGLERHVPRFGNDLERFVAKENGYTDDLARYAKNDAERPEQLAKLKPYENTWHERVIREEVKKAAQDGMTKLQFPVGDTAMKIEGLGTGNRDLWSYNPDPYSIMNLRGLQIDDLKPGIEISRQPSDQWIITDVLGDGKFKAVPKREFDYDGTVVGSLNMRDELINSGLYDDATLNGELFEGVDPQKVLQNKKIKEMLDKGGYTEEFDISGKTDTSNPIYKFYEDRIGKYLKSKYGAQRVKDPQGVEWWEVPVDKQAAHKPVEAFAVAPLAGAAAVLSQKRKEEKKQ